MRVRAHDLASLHLLHPHFHFLRENFPLVSKSTISSRPTQVRFYAESQWHTKGLSAMFIFDLSVTPTPLEATLIDALMQGTHFHKEMTVPSPT